MRVRIETIELVTSLPRAECAARLKAAIDPDRQWGGAPFWMDVSGGHPAIGHASANKIVLRRRHALFGNTHLHAPRFVATLHEENGATVLRCSIGVPLWIRAFQYAVAVFVFVVSGLMFWHGLSLPLREGLPFMLIAPLFPAAAFGFLWWGRWLTSDDGAALKVHVMAVIAAHPRS